MINFSLVIPFYNEEKNIPFVIKSLIRVFKKTREIEFILVNNGSTDKSDKIFRKELKNKKKKHFRYFKIKKNIGYGHGIKFGLIKSKCDYLAWTHADLQTDPIDILKAIKEKKKFNTEKFFIKGKRKKRNSKEAFQTKAMEILSFLILNHRITDINAQPKLITKIFFKKYLKKFAPDDLSLDLYAYYLAASKDYIIREVNVLFKKRRYGETKGGGEGGSILTKLKLILVTLKCLINLKFLKI